MHTRSLARLKGGAPKTAAAGAAAASAAEPAGGGGGGGGAGGCEAATAVATAKGSAVDLLVDGRGDAGDVVALEASTAPLVNTYTY